MSTEPTIKEIAHKGYADTDKPLILVDKEFVLQARKQTAKPHTFRRTAEQQPKE